MSREDCERCESPLEDGDLRCALCGLPTPAERDASVGEAAARVLRCHGCGAAVAYDAEAQAPRCAFCASVMEAEVPEDPIEQAEAFLRFGVDPDRAKAALRAWLGTRGWLRPSDLQHSSRVAELSPLWWVGWIFDADVLMSWAADSNEGSRRSRWAPHSGQARLSLRRVVVPASRGLTEQECAHLVPAYAIDDASPEPPSMPRATIEQFSLQRSSARRLLSEALRGVAADRATSMIPGSTYRALHVEVLPTRLTTRRLAFPAYVLAYRYREQLYRVVVHGQDAAVVIGKAPISLRKIAVIVGVLLALVLIFLLATTLTS